jgi:predicted AlkP superfamily phosphohydrolase/phosphomutase
VLAVVQLDAVSLPLVNELTASGQMPVLNDLRSRGDWHTLESTADHLPAAVYPSMYSGLEVGDHGLHYSYQWSAADQRLRYRHDFGSPTLVWERIAARGHRALVIDPYEQAPREQFAGRAVSGWQYASVLNLERWSVPHGWCRGYERRLGRAPSIHEVFGSQGARPLLSRSRALLSASARVGDLTAEVLRSERVDLFWTALLAGHEAGHAFWDVAHLGLDEDAGARLEPTLAQTYVEADKALGRIRDTLPADADLIVVSPLGMGPDTSRVDLLPEMLALVLAGDGDGAGKRAAQAGSRIWFVRAAVPTSVRAAVARAAGARLSRALTTRLSTSGIDWRQAPAFVLPGDAQGQIRLNVRGREREGIVDPGEVDALVQAISDGLMTFRDLGGGPSVAAVDRGAELFPGRRSGLLPDLLVRWSDTPGYAIAGVRSERYGEVCRRGAGKGRTGGHTADAWALVVPGASRSRVPARRPRITDIAATACAYFGVDSAGSPGEPLLEPGS